MLSAFFLYSCKTPGDVRTETTGAQRMSELELAVANAANTADEIKAEQESLKGHLERLEHLLLEKDAIINTRIDALLGSKTLDAVKEPNTNEPNTNEQTVPASSASDVLVPEEASLAPGATMTDTTASNIDSTTEQVTEQAAVSTKTLTNTKTNAPTNEATKITTNVPTNEVTKLTTNTPSAKDSPVQTLDQKYKKARTLHEQKKYNEAMSLYLEVEGSRSNWYRERAMFYIGVLNYDTNKYKESIISMQEFIDAYPKSKNVPPAILVQAESFIALKQTSDAKVFLNDLILRFPSSKEAQKAKNKIKTL
jgi:TolA-binding protein